MVGFGATSAYKCVGGACNGSSNSIFKLHKLAISIMIENEVGKAVINRHGSKSDQLLRLSRNLEAIIQKRNLVLTAQRISSYLNTLADALS